MKKCMLYHLVSILALESVFVQYLSAQPHLHIERNFEALRLDGNQSWLSFYDGPVYKGYLWNNQGNLTLGTTEFNQNGRLKFVTNQQERMIIDSRGFIGVGVTPEFNFHILGSEGRPLFHVNQTGSGNGAWINTTDGIALVARSSGSIGLEAYSANSIAVSATGVMGVKAIADNVGLLGIASSTTGIGVSGQSASFVGVEGFGGSFDFYADGPGMDYGAVSSRRWKSDIRNIDHPLNKIAALRGVYYTWDTAHGGQHDVGFIAEEVGEVLPEIVAYEENGIDAKGLDYSKMTPLLVEAFNALLREYQETILKLKNRIEQLEKRISDQDRAVQIKPFKTVKKTCK
jgi:hypothetical protein